MREWWHPSCHTQGLLWPAVPDRQDSTELTSIGILNAPPRPPPPQAGCRCGRSGGGTAVRLQSPLRPRPCSIAQWQPGRALLQGPAVLLVPRGPALTQRRAATCALQWRQPSVRRRAPGSTP